MNFAAYLPNSPHIPRHHRLSLNFYHLFLLFIIIVLLLYYCQYCILCYCKDTLFASAIVVQALKRLPK